jgi:hypothetical protein
MMDGRKEGMAMKEKESVQGFGDPCHPANSQYRIYISMGQYRIGADGTWQCLVASLDVGSVRADRMELATAIAKKQQQKRRMSIPAAANHHRWTGATPYHAVSGRI